MSAKKMLWIFVMAVIVAALVLIIGFRSGLYSDVILGGSEGVFVNSGSLKAPLEDYDEETVAKESENKYSDLIFPNLQIGDWQYTIISSAHPVKDYAPQAVPIADGSSKIDARIKANLAQMLMAAAEAGFDPFINCAYVSYPAQQQIINEKASKIASEKNLSFAEARELAKELVDEPGTSDHQTALAVDITDKKYEGELDYSQMDKELFDWLDAHCAEYGFIKRYPADKKDITGRYEPWHYRYVGKDIAQFMYKNNISLEEFAAHYDYQK